MSTFGALRRYDSDRVARLSLLGTMIGGAGALALLVLAVVVDVLS